MDKKPIRREIRYAVHVPRTDYREDCHYIKEQQFFEDGTSKPHTYMVKDFKRPIWVTKPAYRNHQQKKEFESREKTHEQFCTQSDLNKVTAGLLDATHLAHRPDELKDSPYVYGLDRTSTSLIKMQNLKKNNFIQSPYTVAGSDIETDIDTREILLMTSVFKHQVHTSILRKFLQGIPDYEDRLDKAIAKYLPEYHDKLKVKLTVHDTEPELLKSNFETANKWAPDFLAFWNINFDMKRIFERLKEHNVDPRDVICDKDVPRAYRVCRYKEGISKKVTASGSHKPINPSLQWHSLLSTSKFYAIDAMCVYRQIRMAKPEEPSYALNDILDKVLKKRKLTFKEADAYQKEAWHIFMQKNYPIEYIVYNIFDCLGMLEIDDVTNDLKSGMPSGAGITDFAKYNSNPRRIVDALFMFGLKRGLVVGTAGSVKQAKEEEDAIPDELLDSEEDEEEDDGVDENGHESQDKYKGLGLKGWIQMLPQNLLLNEGLKIFHDFPNVRSNFRGTVFDVDATAAYPTCTAVANVSKETCVNEVISIDGISEESFREQNLSVCLGGVNSLDYFHVMYSLPSIDEVDTLLDAGIF